jgi:hypothetical protein
MTNVRALSRPRWCIVVADTPPAESEDRSIWDLADELEYN